jgi:hypothetical protein
MPFCNKCGAQLTDDSRFCWKCGNELDIEIMKELAEEPAAPAPAPAPSPAPVYAAPAPAAFPVQPYTQTAPVYVAPVPAQAGDYPYTEADIKNMSKEDSLALAEKLNKKFSQYEKTKTQIAELEHTVSKPVDTSYARYSAFRFFWPCLIIAPVTFTVLVIIGELLVFATYSAGPLAFCTIIGIIAFAAIMIAGGVSATRKRDSYNFTVSEAAKAKLKRRDEEIKQLNSLKGKLTAQAKELKQYDNILPPGCRKGPCMAKIKILINAGKADNFYDALEQTMTIYK